MCLSDDDSRLIGELSGRLHAVERSMNDHTQAMQRMSDEMRRGFSDMVRMQRGIEVTFDAKLILHRKEITRIVAPLRTVARRVKRYEMTVGAAVGIFVSFWLFFGDLIKEKVHKIIG